VAGKQQGHVVETMSTVGWPTYDPTFTFPYKVRPPKVLIDEIID